MQGCKVYRLHLCCRTKYEMLATILFRPAAFRMIFAFREPFNCEDTANSAFLHATPDIWACVGQYLSFSWAIAPDARAAVSSAAWQWHEALVGGLHVVTVHVGRPVDVAQVEDAVVGIEDERATVVGEQLSGARVVVVEQQVFGVGEFHRDGIVIGVAGLQVSGDEDEILLLASAGVDEEPHGARAVAGVEALLEDLVVWNVLWRLEVPDLQIPYVGSQPDRVSPFRARGPPRLEGLGGRAHLRLLKGPYRFPGKPYREEDDGESQDQGRCTVQVGLSFSHSKS